MPYYVLRKVDDDDEYLRGVYGGKTTFYNGLLWYATSLSPPTKFESESEARVAIEDSKKVFKNTKFRLEEVFEEVENAV